jgi:copper chaperone CopZ
LSSVRPDLAPHLEKSIESVPHVQAVHVEIGSSCVVVEHDGADSAEIIAALREEGFELQPRRKT